MNAPPPPIITAQPIISETTKVTEHIRTLAICHFVFAGLAAIGCLFVVGHYVLMKTVISFANNDPTTSPQELQNMKELQELFSAVFIWVYLGIGLLLVLKAILNFLSGRYLLKKVKPTFSKVVAGLNCISFPMGTTLGVFTFITLVKPAAIELYDKAKAR